jgi:hypothetical protein
VGGTYLDPESTFTMRVSHYVLLEPQGELVGELDPFVQSLHTFYPYAQTRLSLSKFFGERLAAEGGIDLRRVDESADVGSFNRNFERAYLSAHLLDIRASGIDLSLTAESWQGASNDIDTWGVDLSKEVKEGWELSVGSAFSLFKYDLYTDAERFDVRSTFARLRFEVSEGVRIELRYEIEDDGVDSYQELNVRTTWSF